MVGLAVIASFPVNVLGLGIVGVVGAAFASFQVIVNRSNKFSLLLSSIIIINKARNEPLRSCSSQQTPNQARKLVRYRFHASSVVSVSKHLSRSRAIVLCLVVVAIDSCRYLIPWYPAGGSLPSQTPRQASFNQTFINLNFSQLVCSNNDALMV